MSTICAECQTLAESKEVRAILLGKNPKPARGATIHVARRLMADLARLERIEEAAKAWIAACAAGKRGTKCSDYADSLTRCNLAAAALRAAIEGSKG